MRLTEMGVEPFLTGGALRGIINQRLLRCLCSHCKEPAALDAPVWAHLRDLAAQGGFILPEGAVFYRGAGCDACHGWGFRGRTALYELLEFTPAVRQAFLGGASADELTRVAVSDGMTTLVADGIRKAVAGITSVDEVLRVTMAK